MTRLMTTYSREHRQLARSLTTLMTCALFFLVAPIAVAEMTQADKRALFDDADTAFRDAGKMEQVDPGKAHELYQKAALRWERLIKDGGLKNGPLYYNLGNVYVKLDDLGQAILNYRRAERFIPTDPNLAKNLEYARHRQGDRTAGDDASKIKTILLFWHYDLSPTVRTWVFSVAFVLFWVLMIARIVTPKMAPTKGLIVLGMLAALFATSLGADHYARKAYRYGVVTSRQVTARKGDGGSYQPSFSHDLHAGLEFRLMDRRNGWIHIELSDSRDCWIPERSAEIIRSE